MNAPEKQGLGNGVPFFICPFSPEESVAMSRIQQQLINRLEQNGIRILEINLYDLVIELLKGRGIWERILKWNKMFPKISSRNCCKGSWIQKAI